MTSLPATPSAARDNPSVDPAPGAAPAANRATGTPWQRSDWLLLLLVTLLGAALRFYQLGITPPGFQFDEAYNAIDAVQVLEGNRPLFLPANGGREVLFTYFQAALLLLFGESVWSFRLASALWGTAGVAATYLLLRTLLKRESRLIATCGALALAISYWHIHFSHFGIRVITMPVIFSLLFGLYWAATQERRPRRALLLYAGAGLVLGLSVYSNPTGRLAPLVLLAYTAWLLWRDPAARRFAWSGATGGLLLAGGVALLVFLPLGVTFVRHPEFFFGHAAEVSVFAERVSGESSALRTLAVNALHVAGMFSFYGDREWTHGIAGRPLLDWVISIPFVIGALVWAARLVGRRRHADEDLDALWLLFFWVVVMLAPSIFSDAAPNFSRTLPALPATYLPLAFGLAWLVWLPAHPEGEPVRSRWPRPWMGYALAGSILLVSGAITVRDYFVRFPAMAQVYTSYDVDKLDALTLLGERAQSRTAFLSPLWGTHATVRSLRSRYAIRTLDALQAVVLPPQGDAVFAFTGEEEARAAAFAAQWPGLGVEATLDRYGKPLLYLVTVAPSDLDASGWPPGRTPDMQLDAAFDDAPTLLGTQQAASGSFNLFWRAEASTFRNLTAFVHFIDANGARVAQVDRVPGDGSFETPAWRPGERVLDQTTPLYVEPCAGGAPVLAYVGWYEWAAENARRPRLGAPGDLALAGAYTLPVRSYLYAHTLDDEDAVDAAVEPQGAPLPVPAQALDAPMGGAQLFGATLHDGPLRPGEPLTVDLFVRGTQASAAVRLPATLLLADGARRLPLGDATVELLQPLQAGDEACRRVRARLPAAGSGSWTLTLDTESGDVALARVQVEAAATEVQPAPATEVEAHFANGLALLGTNVGAASGGALPVELVWRTEREVEWPVVAFVQLLDAGGVVIAQSDEAPGAQAGAAPVTHWALNAVVADARALPLPDPLPPGPYRLLVGLYDPQTLERVELRDGAGALLPDGAVMVVELETLE